MVENTKEAMINHKGTRMEKINEEFEKLRRNFSICTNRD